MGQPVTGPVAARLPYLAQEACRLLIIERREVRLSRLDLPLCGRVGAVGRVHRQELPGAGDGVQGGRDDVVDVTDALGAQGLVLVGLNGLDLQQPVQLVQALVCHLHYLHRAYVRLDVQPDLRLVALPGGALTSVLGEP